MDGWLDEYVCVCVYNVAIMPYLATAVVRKERKKEGGNERGRASGGRVGAGRPPRRRVSE